MKRFESTGIWFLPSNTDKQIAGTLRFSQNDGLTLTLSGSFLANQAMETGRYEAIQGVVSQSPYGKFISLFQCFTIHRQIGMPGLSLETIRANHGFVGDDFIESEGARFNEAAVYFSPLAAWLDTSGLAAERLPAAGVVARWRRPEPLQTELAEARLSTASELSSYSGVNPASVSFTEIPAFLIQCRDASTADEIHARFVGPLAQLMTFASDNANALTRYSLFLTDPADAGIARFDRLYSPMESPAPKKKRSECRDLLFSLRDVPEDFSSFMQAWSSFVQSHPKFCDIFFAYGYQDTGYVEARFLFRMLAAQILAREEFPDDPALTQMSALRNSALASTELAQQPLARFTMPSVQQMAAPTLFARFCAQHWHIIKDVVDTEQHRFISALYSTLDYVANRTDPTPDAITASSDLLWLSERLSAAIKLCLLIKLGFADDKIADIAARHGRISHLRSVAAPWIAATD